MTFKLKPFAALFTSSLVLTGCLENNEDDKTDNTITTTQAFSVGPVTDYSSASLATIATEAPFSATTGLNSSDKTDVTLSAYQDNLYVIHRYGANTITKYKADAPETALWQCSTEGADTNSNPYQFIQVSESKAYVLRYGTGKIWVVNPSISDSSKCATEWKTGEIDLSIFDGDGVPDMASAVLVDDKLFVAMQRLTFFSPDQTSQVAVIDTQTDMIIDVDTATEGTQAIELVGHNANKIGYLANTDKIYVQSVGAYAKSWTDPVTPAEYTGGIDAIDPITYSVRQIVNDQPETTNQISSMALISETQGYLVGYSGYQDNTLYQFNPTTGDITSETNGNLTAIAGIANENIASIHYEQNSKLLWIATTSGYKLLNTSDNTIVESLIDTQMNPSATVFYSKTQSAE